MILSFFKKSNNLKLGYVPVNGGIGLIKDITNRLILTLIPS